MELAKTQLVKRGDEYLIPLDKTLVDALGLDESTVLEVRVEDRSLFIRPHDPERRRRFEEALAEVNERYGRVLRKLAEQ